MATILETIANGNPGAAFDYGSFVAFEAATDINLVTAGDIRQGQVHDDGGNFAETVIFAGATVNAANYREVFCIDDSFSFGAFTGVAITGNPDGGVVDIQEGFFRLSKLRIINSRGAQFPVVLLCENSNDGLFNMLELEMSGGPAAGTGVGGVGQDSQLRNSIVKYPTGSGTGLNLDRDQSALVYNVTAQKQFNVSGASGSNGPILKNCVLAPGPAYNVQAGSYHASSTNNSGDAGSSPPGANALTNVVNGDFVNSGTSDWRGTIGATFQNQGIDLSGTFTDDISGVGRTVPWDRGANEFGAQVAPMFMHSYRQRRI